MGLCREILAELGKTWRMLLFHVTASSGVFTFFLLCVTRRVKRGLVSRCPALASWFLLTLYSGSSYFTYSYLYFVDFRSETSKFPSAHCPLRYNQALRNSLPIILKKFRYSRKQTKFDWLQTKFDWLQTNV